MNFDPRYYHRRTIRLQNHDYSQPGIYFITICVRYQKLILSEIEGGRVLLNKAGRIVAFYWQGIRHKYSHVIPGHFVIMPDHFHGVIIITRHDGNRDNVGYLGGNSISDPFGVGIDCSIGDDIGIDIHKDIGGGIIFGMGDGNGDGVGRGEVTSPPPTPRAGTKPPTLGHIIAWFKYQSTKQINLYRQLPDKMLWQRNYYERIICTKQEYSKVIKHITDNTKNRIK